MATDSQDHDLLGGEGQNEHVAGAANEAHGIVEGNMLKVHHGAIQVNRDLKQQLRQDNRSFNVAGHVGHSLAARQNYYAISAANLPWARADGIRAQPRIGAGNKHIDASGGEVEGHPRDRGVARRAILGHERDVAHAANCFWRQRIGMETTAAATRGATP